jgi:hypothetical protein
MDPVEEQLLAYNARDLERFIAVYSRDVVIEDGDGNVTMRGHETLRQQYGRLFRESPALEGRVLQRMRVGNYVVDEEQVTGMMGSADIAHAVVIYRVEGGKIVNVRMLV